MSATVPGAACASVIAIGRTGHEMPLAAEARHEDYWHRSRRDRPDRLARARAIAAQGTAAARTAGHLSRLYPGSGRVNTDPDPNVQFEILRQQNWRKGG